MEITGPDEYKANPLEEITVTVRAVNVPFNVKFGKHSSGIAWTVVKPASAADPEEIRKFTLGANDDNFEIRYDFGPTPPDGAHYERTVSGGGTTDGPFDVKPLPGIRTVILRYSFDVAKAATAAGGGFDLAPAKGGPSRQKDGHRPPKDGGR